MKRIGLVVKQDEHARARADELAAWLVSREIEVLRRESMPPGYVDVSEDAPPEDLDCVVVLGGDGTFLSAARWIGHRRIPILGIKFGDVGFLAETVEENLFSAMETLLARRFVMTPRMRLQVEVLRGQGRETKTGTVLNDVVINKGALARLANIRTCIDDYYLTTFRADGLIICTPTGSTAYSLAAGGPVVHPSVHGIVITPICPFTLTNRPLILPDSVTIEVRMEEKSEDIMLTFDGQAGLAINDQDIILIQKSPFPLYTITLPRQQYFDVLKTKLRWSGGRV